MVSVKDINFSYHSNRGREKVLKNINFQFKGFYGFIGPNGSGKTTLFKIFLGILKPLKGEILINGKNILKLSPIERARILAWVPQFYPEIYGLNVFDIVCMGRYSRKRGTLERTTKEDREKVLKILEELNLLEFEKRDFSTLSGGERQKVMIARSLSQEPEVLLMDEPTAHLDYKNQFEILTLLRKIKEKKNLSILGVFHNPFLAFSFLDGYIFIKDGEIKGYGNKDKIFTRENLKELYEFDFSKIVNFKETIPKF